MEHFDSHESHFFFCHLASMQLCCVDGNCCLLADLLSFLLLQLAPVFVEQVMSALHLAHNPQQQQQQKEPPQQQQQVSPRMRCEALLQYLPLPGEMQNPFLAKASTDIVSSLKHAACILSASGVLCLPHQLLLPSPLLVRPNGQLLIPNKWLQKGLPGREYVHLGLLTAADGGHGNQRALDVLLQLGSSMFDAKVLVAWLNAEATRQLLQDLPVEERASWLQDLYSCMVRMNGSSSSSIIYSRDVAAAPIIQLDGSRRLVSYQEVQGGEGEGKLFMWDPQYGGENERAIFSSSSIGSGLLFVDPGTLDSTGMGVIRQYFGIEEVPLDLLVSTILEWQDREQYFGTQQQL